MASETAFCTNCGAVVGEGWESCRACGTAQPVDVTAVGEAAGSAPARATNDFWSRSFRSLGIDGGDPSVATYLYVAGGACLLAAVIYFLATAGFPPSTTTTYEFHPDGTTTTSSSPDTLEFLISFGLFVIGGVLVRAGKAARDQAARRSSR
jgi:hypothetical protein